MASKQYASLSLTNAVNDVHRTRLLIQLPYFDRQRFSGLDSFL
jgi:hypothetical protein